jgi:NAD(P)-dependent dehydrogenase (short-subunit alcohol dehydrogenase family)
MDKSMQRARSARTGAPIRQPKPPFKKQRQDPPGLESELKPAPRYKADRYKPTGKLLGQAALITGGDSGIGRAVAVLFAREGADVAIVYLPEEQSDAEKTKAEVQARGRRCELIPGDLAIPNLREGGREDSEDVWSPRRAGLNAAQQSSKELAELEETDLVRTFETNILPYAAGPRRARYMKPGAGSSRPVRDRIKARARCRTTRRPRGRSTRSQSRWRSICSSAGSASMRLPRGRYGRR